MGSKEETGEGDDEIYVVEEILDYDLVQVDNKKGEEGYDAKLPAKRWEVRYLVKWKNYSEEWNSYEPRSCFVEWDDAYDAKIRLLQKRDKEKQSPKKLDKKAEELNQQARDKVKKKRKEKATKSVQRQTKVKVEKDVDDKSAKLKPPPQRAGSASTSSSRLSPYPSAPIVPKSRTTRNSLLDADSAGLATFINSENAPSSVRQLAFEGAPRRDASGQLIASSSDGEDEKPDLQAVEESASHNAPGAPPAIDLGFADSDSDVEGGGAPQPILDEQRIEGDGGGADCFAEESDVEMEGSGRHSAAAEVEGVAGDVAGDDGWAESDENEPAMEGVGTTDGDTVGFADASDEEEEQAAVVAAQPSLNTAEDDSDEPLARRPPPKRKGKNKEAESIAARSKKTRLPPPEPTASKKKADTSKSSTRKRLRVAESDSDSDSPRLTASRPTTPPAAAPKLGLQALKFKKHSELAQVALAPKPATPLVPAPAPPPIHHSASPPIIPPQVPLAPVQRLTSNDPSRDPRRRPGSVDVDGRSQSDKTSDSTKKAQVDDPFNRGVVRPVSVNGFVPLDSIKLEPQLKASNFFVRHGGAYNPQESLDERVRKIWGIGNPLVNFFDFNAVMSEGPDGRPRTAFIYASQKDEALSKESRAIKSDCIALQLILSSISGVKQADSLLAPAVSAVFVHVSDIGEIGRYPTGKLAGLEALRERPVGHTIFVVFGERERVEGRSAFGYPDPEGQTTKGREKVFEQFWSTTAAVTFTPAAFLKDSNRTINSNHSWTESLNRWPGERDIFPWAHVSYLLPGGPFHLPPKATLAAQDLQAPDQLTRRQTLYDFISAVRNKTFSLVQEVPRAGPHSTTYFPSAVDRFDYAPEPLSRLARWLPAEAHLNSADQLQKLAAIYKSQYLHIRRWIVIATEAEILSVKTRLPGIDLLTLEQAECELSRPALAGPH